MTISSTIPSTRIPGANVDFDSSKALSGLARITKRVLIIGQMLGTGAAPALKATSMASKGAGIAAFGRGSMLAQMVDAFIKANPQTELWAVGVNDLQAGVAATKTLTLTGSASAAGTLPLLVAGAQVAVAVAIGDTAATIATAIVEAVGDLPDLEMTATAALGVVTFTARHKGVEGNGIDIRLGYYDGDQVPAGITGLVAAGTTGAGNPDISTVWAALGEKQYHSIIAPWTDAANLTALNTELTRRAGPMVQLDAMGYTALAASMSSAAALGASVNYPFISAVPVRKGPTTPWKVAAIWGAVIAYYGGIDPARPFTTLTLTGMLPPVEADRFDRTERELLLHDGMSTFTVGDDGTCYIERAITTYQKTANGVEDEAWLDVNTPLTVFEIRAQTRTRIKAKYPRHKLADDGTRFDPNQPVVTPASIRKEIIALGGEMEKAGLIEDLDQFKADLIVDRDSSNRNQLNAVICPNLVNQFLNFAGTIQFIL